MLAARMGLIWFFLVGFSFALIASPRIRITQPLIEKLIHQDLRRLPSDRREQARYLSLANYYNRLNRNGEYAFSQEQMATFRFGVSKFLNSLSWNPKITPPEIVENSKGTLLRFYLDDYVTSRSELGFGSEFRDRDELGVDEISWDVAGILDPYGSSVHGPRKDAIERLAGTYRVLLRADSFIANFVRDESYESIMGLDLGVKALEKQFLGLTAVERIQKGHPVIRAGFAQSGVANHNRIIERHPVSAYDDAALWMSYDFDSNYQRSSVFASPIGPNKLRNKYGRQTVFEHKAGEVILELPNHLHAYWLSAKGKRYPQSEAPIELVRDPLRGAIASPISCMDCHAGGILRKADEVRELVEGNINYYSDIEVDFVRYAFPSLGSDLLSRTFDEDNARYRQALLELEIPADASIERAGFQPINKIYDLFTVEPVTIEIAAAELGVSKEKVQSKILRARGLPVELRKLTNPRGAISREVFEEYYLKLEKIVRAPQRTASCPEALIDAVSK